MAEDKKKGSSSLGKALVFEAGGEKWACELLRIREIVRSPQITGLPNSLSNVAGVINVRGEVVPVLNFWKDHHPITRGSGSGAKETVVILRSDEGNVGLKVSQVCSIEDIHAFDIGSDADDTALRDIVSCKVYLSESGLTPMVDAKLVIESVKSQAMDSFHGQSKKEGVSSGA